MRRSKFARWALAAALAVAAFSALAQQNEGPILLPKPKPVAKPAGPTLLVICDLACNWKLDGKERGHIAAGGSATANVVTGQHLVIATTEDGVDQVKQLVKAEEKGQTVVSIELQPVRDARLKAEQEAKDKADQQTRDKAAQEARDKAAQAETAGTWTDSATGLMWTKKDNGSNVTWQQAMDYCRNLQLARHSDWHLPTIDELQGIYDANANAGSYHVKGNLQLSYWEWSNSPSFSGAAFNLDFHSGGRAFNTLDFQTGMRALCVRHSRE